jgi:hypothetical protein
MELINDLGTELAFAFLVEKRHRQAIESKEALALIDHIRDVLEATSNSRSSATNERSSGTLAAN